MIDPVLDIAAYIGGLKSEGSGFAIATDASENVFVAGRALALSGGTANNTYDAVAPRYPHTRHAIDR